ncbi:MAG: ABC-F family ATP-binding cassette domain-containing protein, partial [Candidatus Cloacimonetes bacterium]|nr:ABC-F family ATP-binding cassette domain-containing protein [Candidatus Cloacimonadota bacterium]
TLLRILAGLMDTDEGEIVTRKGMRVSAAFQEADKELPADQSVQSFLQGAVEHLPWQDYEKETAVDQAIKRFGFKDREKLAGELSGGWRKRLSLAAAIAARPDLLILDEPTNHLDLEAVLELETILSEQGGSFIVVTHDRAFLQAISNRIIELNPRYPSGYLSVSGSFADFLRIKEEKLSEQANLEQSLASKIRR